MSKPNTLILASALMLAMALALPLGAQTIQQQQKVQGSTGAPKDAAPPTKAKTQQGGKDTVRPTKKPGLAKATTSIECGGKTYEVTTGNKEGSCSLMGPSDGKYNQVTCTDGRGNTAEASCQHGCGGAAGSGSCTVK